MAPGTEPLQAQDPILVGDRALVARVCTDDERAVEQLLDRRCGFIIRHLASTYGFEDLRNELYLRLREHDWRRLRTWEGRSALCAWIKQVAIRICLEQKKSSPDFQQFDKVEELIAGSPDRHYGHDATLRRIDLMNAIRSLPAIEQSLILRHILFDVSLPELARELSISAENAHVIKHRAVKRLRERLLSKGANR